MNAYSNNTMLYLDKSALATDTVRKNRIMPIVKFPNPILTQVAEPVKVIDGDIVNLANDMLTTMNRHWGAGLAAPQVGVSKRVIVAGLEGHDYVMINPVVTESQGNIYRYEKCFSWGRYWPRGRWVRRPRSLTVEYSDLSGRRFEQKAIARGASLIQHEVDHLDGIVIAEKVSQRREHQILLESQLV
jgi:peptide deformylase